MKTATRISRMAAARLPRLRFGISFLLALMIASLETAAQQIRSTHYDGTSNAFVEFSHRPEFDEAVAMTVEAWIYRENMSRCETIVSHNFRESYWFGCCGDSLRFYRSGGTYADAGVNVPADRWAHVAAAYDGTRVRFYMDGELIASRTLGHSGANKSQSLHLGSDAAGFRFQGNLDEVRIWSRSLSQSEIQDGMFREVRSGTGLKAVFPAGGPEEALSGRVGTGGTGAKPGPFGILPRDLLIPKAAGAVTVDGLVGLDFEYAGAEQLVIRYGAGDGIRDAVAHLVYRDELGDRNLYVGIRDLRNTIGGWSRGSSTVGLLLDPNHSRDRLAQRTDLQLRIGLDGESERLLVGTGTGGFVSSSMAADWEVASSFFHGGDLNPPTLEFRVSHSLLGEWAGGDGLALGHFDVSSAGIDYLAPVEAEWNSPETWAAVSYGDLSAPLPKGTVSGTVRDPVTGNPVAGHNVFLMNDSSGLLLHTRTTDASGAFDFDRAEIPSGAPLRLLLDECASCRVEMPEISVSGIGPEVVRKSEVIFPGCDADECAYAAVHFKLVEAPGELRLLRFEPRMGAPRLTLREAPLKQTEPEIVTITGVHLHELIEVYMYGCLDLPPIASCVEGVDYFRARIVERAPDRSWIRVEVPEIPSSAWGRRWAWVVRDRWVRPSYQEWNRLGGGIDNSFIIWPANYPAVSGFEFENEFDSAGWAEFTAVYGNNAYICLGLEIDGSCAGCRVPDPLYLLWFAVYKVWIDNADGSCNGMASTSLLFHQGALDTEAFQRGVHFPAGFSGRYGGDAVSSDPITASLSLPSGASLRATASAPIFEPSMQWKQIRFSSGVTRQIINVLSDTDVELAGALPVSEVRDENFYIRGTIEAPKPARYTMFNPCGPQRPRNLWAHISVNHGVQTTDEYIQAVLAQMDGAGLAPDSGMAFSVSGNPLDVLSRIRGRPTGYVISMVPRLGKGHVVTPYRVEPVPGDTARARIMVYDNNYPEDATRFIEINSRLNSYKFPRADDIWSGDGIYAIPIEVWQGPRTALGLSTAGDLAGLLVFGEADALHTGKEGGQWGWDADGNPHDSLPGARAIVPASEPPDSETRTCLLFIPVSEPPPATEINVRGEDYTFHAAHGGTVLQLETSSGVAGEKDRVQIGFSAGRLSSFEYSPQSLRENLEPRIGMALGPRERAVFRWSGLQLDTNDRVVFRALNEARGVEVENRSDREIEYRLLVDTVDGESSTVAAKAFGPFQVPARGVHQVTLANWPSAEQLTSKLDADGDGQFDSSETVEAGPQPEPPTIAFGFPYRPLGDGEVVVGKSEQSNSEALHTSPSDGQGDDGVEIRFAGVQRARLELTEPFLAEQLPDGASQQFTICTEAGVPLGMLTLVKHGSQFEQSIDFTPIGSTTHRLRILLDGTVVLDESERSGTVTAQSSLGAAIAGGLERNELSIAQSWETPVDISIEGESRILKATEIQWLSETGGELKKTAIHAAQLRSSHFPVVTITGVATKVQISGRITGTSGQQVSAVAVELEGAVNQEDSTDHEGRYIFADLDSGGDYLVRPVKAGLRFTPAEQLLNSLAANAEIDFLALSTANDPTELKVQFVDGEVLISWPPGDAFMLQQASSLSAPIQWSEVGSTTDTTLWIVPAEEQLFFRLRRVK